MNNLTSIEKTNSQESDWFDLRNLFYDLLEQKWVILAVTFFTVAIGILYAATKIPQYQSNVLLQVMNKQKSPMGMIGSLSSQMNFVSSTEDPAAIQAALIRSRFILQPVIKC